MRRVLVPLDGSPLAEAILPDACRVAGTDGEVVLFQAMRLEIQDPRLPDLRRDMIVASREYLDTIAQRLCDRGVRATVAIRISNHVPTEITDAALELNVDMIVMGTHGRAGFERLMHGGVSWQVVAHSNVPVMMRHFVDAPVAQLDESSPPRVLMPTDGSELSLKALPLAAALANEWGAELVLAEVTPDLGMITRQMSVGMAAPVAFDAGQTVEDIKHDAEVRLAALALSLPPPVRTVIRTGHAVDELCSLVKHDRISHVVLASHGRSGVARALLGSTADALVHRLMIPVTIVPALSDLAQRDPAREVADVAAR
jgi:nucleotide-binding universal stress UspA family protein